MAQLAEVLAQVRANEIARAESALANQLALPPVSDLDEDTQKLLVPFVRWCNDANVRHAPALPTTCAAFILSQHKIGIAPERIAAVAQAIEELHDYFGLPNPVQTRACSHALEQVFDIEAPRSWPKEARAEFVQLPPLIRKTIADREKDRERTLRRAQNELAELRKTQTRKEDDNADQDRTILQGRQQELHDIPATREEQGQGSVQDRV
jgi:hypothetical protein